jgi:HK97 family phage major capsid protein
MTEVVTTEQRNHAAEISKLAASVAGAQELALRSIQEQHTVEQFQQELIRHMSTKPVPTADLGMDKKEVKRYSLMRAVNAMANPADFNAQRAAAFELECSSEMAKKLGRQAQGFYVPYDILVAKRDLTVASKPSAGDLVDTTLATASFIDLLRARMVIGGLGVQYLTGLVGDIDIPRQTGSATTYWLAEQSAPIKSDQTVDRVNMSPKTVGAKTIISRKLRQQASLDVEAMVQRDLATALALEMERAIIAGSGANDQPLGLLNVAGIGSVAAGAGIGWDTVVDLETEVSVANADVGSLAYLTNAKVRGLLKKTFVDGPGTGERVWQNGSTPLNGYNAAVTNLVPSNLGGDKSAILFGNFNDVIVGMWGGLDILVNPYTGGDQGDVSIRVLQDIDVALRHAESFAACKDVATA